MSWYRPANVAEMARSIRARHGFDAPQFSLVGRAVSVLSSQVMRGVHGDDPLTRRLVAGAREVTRVYLEEGSRLRAPSAPVYYIADALTGRVVLIVERDGTVRNELSTLTRLHSRTRRAIINAAHDLATVVAAAAPEKEI